MKNLSIKVFAILSLFVGFTSCESFLDIEPETSLSTALALDNIEGAEAAINGAYSTMHSDWVERQYLFAECLSQTVKEVNTLSNINYQRALNHESWTDLFNTANYMWDLSYRSIDLANKVLQALPDIEAPNAAIEEKKAYLEGEALFVRGLNYFVLNRFFGHPINGLSVPLLTEPFIPGDQPTRATIDEVKDLVVADLRAAEILMEGLVNNNNRATIWSVRGLMARVYFEYKDYEQAEFYANAVIESGAFTLNDEDLLAGYSTNISTENIFTFLGTPIDRAASGLFNRFSLESANVQLSVSDDFWPYISPDANDLRTTVLYEDLGAGVACHKYDNRDMNIAYIRLPEMYLIRAETRAIMNKLDDALADLNRLKERAGTAPVSYTDQNDLLDKIKVDRSLELSMEGDHFHNQKRLEESIGGLPWEEARYKLVFFIPEKETQLNPNLIQNDTW